MDERAPRSLLGRHPSLIAAPAPPRFQPVRRAAVELRPAGEVSPDALRAVVDGAKNQRPRRFSLRRRTLVHPQAVQQLLLSRCEIVSFHRSEVERWKVLHALQRVFRRFSLWRSRRRSRNRVLSQSGAIPGRFCAEWRRPPPGRCSPVSRFLRSQP